MVEILIPALHIGTQKAQGGEGLAQDHMLSSRVAQVDAELVWVTPRPPLAYTWSLINKTNWGTK